MKEVHVEKALKVERRERAMSGGGIWNKGNGANRVGKLTSQAYSKKERILPQRGEGWVEAT